MANDQEGSNIVAQDPGIFNRPGSAVIAPTKIGWLLCHLGVGCPFSAGFKNDAPPIEEMNVDKQADENQSFVSSGQYNIKIQKPRCP